MPRRTSLPVTFVVPTLAILLVLSMVPTLYAIVIALQNRELSTPDYSYVWLSNFVDLFLDRRFLNSVWVSVKWEIVTVVATMVVAIGLGVLMFEVAIATPAQRLLPALHHPGAVAARLGGLRLEVRLPPALRHRHLPATGSSPAG